MKNIVILATAHQYQILGNAQNAALEKRLIYLRSKFDVQTLMEEWSVGKAGESFAQAFAKKANLHWANVGTPDEPKFKTYWAPITYPGHDGTLPYDPDAPSLDEYGPIENQEAREAWMLKQIELEMHSYQKGLFIVGIAHIHSIFAKLSSLGYSVTGYIWL